MQNYGFGIVGCGRIAKNHAAAIQNIDDVRLTAVSDKDIRARSEYSALYGCNSYSGYRDMLKDPEVDIVCICTPSGLHARMAIDALLAGKHVLVEKPMAMSLGEADAMIATARKTGKKLGVVYPARFNAAVQKLRVEVERGKFGQFTHGSVVVRWNRNEDYYRQSPWRGTLALDGGCLMNQAIHGIDLLQWMLGPVESIFGHTTTKLRKIEAEDLGIAIIKFKDGALGTVEAATTIYPSSLEEKLCLFGATGSVIINGKGFSEIATWRFPGEDIQAEPNTSLADFNGHQAVIADFVASVDSGCKPMADGNEGRKALEIVLAIYHSAKAKHEISLPLQEQFSIGVGLS